MTDPPHPPPPRTPGSIDSDACGQENIASRKSAMLGELLDDMERVHRRRRAMRRVRSAGGALVILLALVVLLLPEPATRIEPGDSDGTNRIVAEAAPRSTVEIIRTDPGVLDRYAARPATRVRIIDDDELLAELAAMNRPAGLIRMGGEVRLTADVVDPPLDRSAPLPSSLPPPRSIGVPR